MEETSKNQEIEFGVDRSDNISDGEGRNQLEGDRISELVAKVQAEKETEAEVQGKKAQPAEDSD